MLADTEEFGKIIAERGAFHVKSSDWKPPVIKSLIFAIGGILALTLIVSSFWIIYAIYARVIADRKPFSWFYLADMLLPFLAVSALVTALFSASLISGTDIGDPTTPSIFFTGLTILFALFSLISFTVGIYGIRKQRSPVWARWYGLISSSALIFLTVYMGYWGLIGLRFWAY
jgi:hypothetical protein